MDLGDAKAVLAAVGGTSPAPAWNQQLVTAVQRALAELYLLNPNDDVDGTAGPRTLYAWKLFKQAATLPAGDDIDGASAARLARVIDIPGDFIGTPKVPLQEDFAFRRRHGADNRAASVAAIKAAAADAGLTREQLAYVLATAEHESDSFNSLEEYASGVNYEGRDDLGNSQPGDGVRFKGRGYVQLTGRINYTRYSAITGINLVQLPVILMNWAALSVFVIVHGMMRGAYTGRRLDEFVNPGQVNFVDARQVVNDHDCAAKIAAQAEAWLRSLP